MNMLPLLRMSVVAIAAIFGIATPLAAQEPPVIAAAADLQLVMQDVAAQFKTETGREVRLRFGASGDFFQQLKRGALFQMFLSADESFVFKLADAGMIIGRGTLYAVGRIVLFAPKGSVLKVDAKFDDLRSALADGRVHNFAIANPKRAPYGLAAEQALRNQGLWDAIKPKLLLGEDVSQAALFTTSGLAEGGIFAYSLALSPSVRELGTFALIPADWHAPLLQRMVLMKGAGDTAQAFYRYVQAPASRAVFRKYGFVLPDEAD